MFFIIAVFTKIVAYEYYLYFIVEWSAMERTNFSQFIIHKKQQSMQIAAFIIKNSIITFPYLLS